MWDRSIKGLEDAVVKKDKIIADKANELADKDQATADKVQAIANQANELVELRKILSTNQHLTQPTS